MFFSERYLPNKSFICEAGVRAADGALYMGNLCEPPGPDGGTMLVKYSYWAVNADIRFSLPVPCISTHPNQRAAAIQGALPESLGGMNDAANGPSAGPTSAIEFVTKV